MTQELKDSGKRRTFASGAVRDRGDLKPRPDLISPHANLREGMIFALGAEKYAPRNWELGMGISECLASTQRHIEQYKRGDTDEDHIAQARWNLGAIIHYEEEIKAGRMDPALDDMPKYGQQLVLPAALCSDDANILRRKELLERVDAGEMLSDRENGWLQNHLDDFSEPGDERQGPNGPERFVQYTDNCCGPAITPTFYICGPMTGLPACNFPAFDRARDRGLKRGYNIISPADMDREVSGIDVLTDPAGWKCYRKENPAFLDDTIDRDIGVIRHLLVPKHGDGLALLPGWQKSKGANAEIGLARWRGLRFVDARYFHPIRMEL